MGKVIRGPWKQVKTESPVVAKPVVHGPAGAGAAIDYPWHTLTPPPNTSLEEYGRTLADLQYLAMLAGNSGGILCLPIGWSWDLTKNQALIEQLEAIYSGDDSLPPDDIA